MIDEGTRGPLTLVSALPGAGKTVALTSWLAAQRTKPVLAWLSLEAQDVDSTRFWGQILESIRLALSPKQWAPFASVTPPRVGGGERFVARLIGAVETLPRELILVVDDAQEISHGDASRELERLVWLAPEQLRVVLSTTSDPGLSLPRLRARGSVVEIRARDLAFTPTEAAVLLHGLEQRLTPEQVLQLTHRTEGWAAALRLASISLRDRPDRDEFIREFAANDRTTADYLIEEVLGRIPQHLQRFLLRTSIVNRFTADLAEALTEDEKASSALYALEHEYSLVMPLGDGEWYRYHRLLAQILPALLAHEHLDEVPRLHGIAARWFAENGMVTESVRHAIDARDERLTGKYLADVALTKLVDPESIPLRSLIAEAHADPTGNAGVAVTLAAARLGDGDPEAALRLVAKGTRSAEPRHAGHAHRVRARLGSVGTAASREVGNVARVLHETDSTIDGAGQVSLEERKYLDAVFHGSRGWALLWTGDLGHARAELQEGIAAARAAREERLQLDAHAQLSLLELMHGRVATAHDLARSSLSQADDWGLTSSPEAAAVYLALAWVHDERGAPDAAEGFLEGGHEALRSGDVRDAPRMAIEAFVRARVHRWCGQSNVGANLLSATRRRMRDPAFAHLSGFVAVEEAAMHLAAGSAALAERALERVPRSARPTGELVVRARLLRAVGEEERAGGLLLDHLLGQPQTHLPDVVEAYALMASILAARGDTEAAWAAQERALHLAAPHGIARPFVLQEGASELLSRQLASGTAHEDLCHELLASIESRSPSSEEELLVDGLSDRERTVLQAMSTLMSVEEIANELFVSTNTVKTHVKHIYRKLEVGRRRDAVERGRALHLITDRPAAG